MNRHALRILILGILILGSVAASAASDYVGHVDGVIIIGDQLFSGGRIEVSSLGASNYVTISIDGRPVAIMDRATSGPWPDNPKPELVLRYDSRGFRHLTSLRLVSRSNGAIRKSELRVASLSRGIATVPSYETLMETGTAIAADRGPTK